MIEPEVRAADEILRRQKIQYVVVGGQAIAQQAATATRDVDVMVATNDFRTTIRRLQSEKELTMDWEDDQIARFRIRSAGGVPLDVINSSAFSGTKTGEEFFRFLTSDGSSPVDGVLYATPEVVWYTRLLTKRWKAYAEKIVTNVIDGVSSGRLNKVEEVARRFGSEATIHERIAYVREELARPDIESLIKRP
jgi:predicted nucleotidyltransferase